MKKIFLPVLIFLLSFLTVYADDLSDYPNLLIKDGKLDIIIVVGDKSSSSNVLAQANIAASLVSLGQNVNIKNRLSSEIYDLNQNIISIGNPCINTVTAQIMGNPQPCDKDFTKGKAYIKLYKSSDFFHLVIAGYSDLGTRRAAEILANYQGYNFEGNEYVVNISEEKTQEENKNFDITIIDEGETETMEAISEAKSVESKANATMASEDMEEKQQPNVNEIEEQIEQTQPKNEKQQTPEEKQSFIRRLVEWLLSLFK